MNVIREYADGRLDVVCDTARTIEEAREVAALVHTLDPTVKCYVQTPDSADQLQVSRRGRVVRDQPGLAAVGENVTIYVPTARAGSRAHTPGGDA